MKKIESTYQRSFMKGLCWEGVSFIITTLAVYIFYGNIITSLKFSIALSIVKVFLFFVHERFWKTIMWGKCGLKCKAKTETLKKPICLCIT